MDKENRLVGIVTIDDILDVVRQEATEDMAKWPVCAHRKTLSEDISLVTCQPPHGLVAGPNGFGHDQRYNSRAL